MVRTFAITAFIVIMGLAPVTGQIGKYVTLRSESSVRKHAEVYFERQAYSHAAKLFQKIVKEYPEDQQIKLRLGDCYRLLREPHAAAYWYDQALQKDQSPTEHLFYFASMLCAVKKYQEAKFWYSEYLKVRPNEKRAMAALKSLDNPTQLFDYRFEVQQLPIDIAGGVFSPSILGDGLVFVGEGSTGSLVKKMTTWIEGPYFDLYYLPLIDGKPGNPKYLDDRLNSVFHEGPATFFEDGNKVIFTRSAFKKGEDDTRNLQLMIAERNSSGNWTSPKKLFYDQDYSIGHPAINKEGTIIYFASNMSGGFGGADIYRSELKEGIWQEPVNAGADVNTPGNELFPSLDDENALYFASDGLGGLGGLDIFKVDKLGYDQPQNLGFPINSPGDDFSIVWTPNHTVGYFSSNRKGADRIFKCELSEGSLAESTISY